MRRTFYLLLIVALAFTAIGCPPSPRVEVPVKKSTPVLLDTTPQPIDSPDLLKQRVELALEQVKKRELLTTHAFWTVFHGILGMGLNDAMLTNEKTKERVNAIDYICTGGEVKGMQFLPTPDGLDVQIGPQFEGQGHQDQFVAEMAQWGMPIERPFRVGGRDFTFEDFTRHSKARTSIKEKQELSWAIIIVGQYYDFGKNITWINRRGEEIRYEDVVRYELNEPIDTAACGGTHRLFGLTWAYHLHLKYGGKKEGVWKEVETKLQRYKQLARTFRSSDGSLSTDYFKGRDRKPDPQLRISTTGHMVEWLALAMTDAELKSAWMQEAVNALALMILNMEKDNIESGALYHASHGLYLYHARVFGTPPAFLPLPPKGS